MNGPLPVVKAAQAFQVRRVGRAAVGIGNGVVDVGLGGGPITPRGATRQVPAPHEVGQFLGCNVVGFSFCQRQYG